MSAMMTVEDRFWAKVSKHACWTWVASKSDRGYGTFNAGALGTKLAHRFAWELLRGPIPIGHELDHLCRNRACVNPDHLEPVTHKVNSDRGWGRGLNNSAKLCCPHGHAYTPENTYTGKNGKGRRCKTCHKAQGAKAKANYRAKRAAARRAARGAK